MKKEPIEIAVKVVTDPGGELGVLIQLPNGWTIISPEGARVVAQHLTITAEECERAQSQEP